MRAQKAAKQIQKEWEITPRLLRRPQDEKHSVFYRAMMGFERAIEDIRATARGKPGASPTGEILPSKVEIIGETRHGNPLKAVASFDSARVCYSDQAPKNPVSETPIVFLSGWLCYPSIWRRQAEDFGDYFRIIRPRARGHFGSGLGASTTTTYIHDCARDLAVIFKSEGIKKVILVGHSMGGLISLQFYKEFVASAKANGTEVAALALINAPSGDPFKSLPVNLQKLGPLADVLSFELQHIPLVDRLKKTRLVNNSLFRRIAYSVLAGTIRKNPENKLGGELGLLLERAAEVPVETGAMALRAMRRVNLYPSLKEIRAPTFVLAGLDDLGVHWEHSEAIAKSISAGNGGGEVVLVKMACGHMPMMGFPDKINYMLMQFFIDKVPELRDEKRLHTLLHELKGELQKNTVTVPYRVETWQA